MLHPEVQRGLMNLPPGRVVEYLGRRQYLDWLEHVVEQQNPSLTAIATAA